MNLVIHLFCFFFFFTLHWHRLHIKSRAKKRIIIIIIKKLVFKISKILKSQCFPPNLLNKKLLFIVEWQFYFWDRSQRRLELLVFSWDAKGRQRGRRNRDAKGGGGPRTQTESGFCGSTNANAHSRIKKIQKRAHVINETTVRPASGRSPRRPHAILILQRSSTRWLVWLIGWLIDTLKSEKHASWFLW